MKKTILLTFIAISLVTNAQNEKKPYGFDKKWIIQLGGGLSFAGLLGDEFTITEIDMRKQGQSLESSNNTNPLQEIETKHYPGLNLTLSVGYVLNKNFEFGLNIQGFKAVRRISNYTHTATDPSDGIEYNSPGTNLRIYNATPYIGYRLFYSETSALMFNLGAQFGKADLRSQIRRVINNVESIQIVSTNATYVSPFFSLGIDKQLNEKWGYRFMVSYIPVRSQWDVSETKSYKVDGVDMLSGFDRNQRDIIYISNPQSHNDSDRPIEKSEKPFDMPYIDVVFSIYYRF